MESTKKNERRSYILRLWRLEKDEQWHIMLQSVEDAKERHFATITQFVSFLEQLERQ